MFFMFMTFLIVNAMWLGAVGFLVWRVVKHLQGNPLATSVVVEHVLLPIIGGKQEKPEEWTPEDGPKDGPKEVF